MGPPPSGPTHLAPSAMALIKVDFSAPLKKTLTRQFFCSRMDDALLW